MWRSVFLHEFIDHRITNCQALAGRPTPASLALAADDTAVPGTNAAPIRRGSGFEYLLDAPLGQVIGVSCRVRLMYPLNPQPFMFPVIRLGAGAELLLWPQSHPLPDLSGTLALARIWLARPSRISATSSCRRGASWSSGWTGTPAGRRASWRTGSSWPMPTPCRRAPR